MATNFWELENMVPKSRYFDNYHSIVFHPLASFCCCYFNFYHNIKSSSPNFHRNGCNNVSPPLVFHIVGNYKPENIPLNQMGVHIIIKNSKPANLCRFFYS